MHVRASNSNFMPILFLPIFMTPYVNLHSNTCLMGVTIPVRTSHDKLLFTGQSALSRRFQLNLDGWKLLTVVCHITWYVIRIRSLDWFPVGYMSRYFILQKNNGTLYDVIHVQVRICNINANLATTKTWNGCTMHLEINTFCEQWTWWIIRTWRTYTQNFGDGNLARNTARSDGRRRVLYYK